MLGLLCRHVAVEAMTDYVQSCGLLFRGTHGLGMSYCLGCRGQDERA